MWGFNVTDKETIPSKFAQLYQQSAKYTKSLHVTNFGTRAYISFQEFKLLQDRLLFEDNYPNQKKDPICDKDSFPVYKLLNPEIESLYQKMDNSLYLADMLDGTISLPFIDRVHYSPAMNEAIARRLIHKLDSLLTK
jgi:hypothetical protein